HLLIPLSALDELVGDGAGAAGGVVVVAVAVSLGPGRRAVTGGAEVAQALRIAGAQRGAPGLGSDVEVRQASDILAVVEHDRGRGAAGEHRERRAAGTTAQEVRRSGDGTSGAGHGRRA